MSNDLELANTIIAGVALFLSGYAIWTTSRFNQRQKSLIESQEELNRRLLEKEDKEDKLAQTAQLGARFSKTGRGDKLKVFNKGPGQARNVRIEFPDGNETVIKSEIEAIFDASVRSFETRERPLTPEERELYLNPESRARAIKSIRAQAVATTSTNVLDHLKTRDLAIAVITKANKSFVTGSFPSARLTSSGNTELSDPGTEMWLPVAHDVAVSPGGTRGQVEVIRNVTDQQIPTVNEIIAKQSTTIAGRSPTLIKSLAAKLMRPSGAR